MDKPKLNFRFHNSNSAESLTRTLLRFCIDANMERVEKIIREEAMATLDESEYQSKNSLRMIEYWLDITSKVW